MNKEISGFFSAREFLLCGAALSWIFSSPSFAQNDETVPSTPAQGLSAPSNSVPSSAAIPASGGTGVAISPAAAVISAEEVPPGEPGVEPPSLEKFLRLRDPFKRPQAILSNVVKTVLENFPVNSFKMIGVLTGPYQTRALIMDPEGKTHFLAVNMKIGVHDGKVIQIAPDRIRVREKIPNILGKLENNDTDILLQAEGKLPNKPADGAGSPSIGNGSGMNSGAPGMGAMGQIGHIPPDMKSGGSGR